MALFIIRQLVEHHKSYKNLIDDLDWYILPLANPDGYVFTHTVDRLWRKSRSANEETSGRSVPRILNEKKKFQAIISI